MRYKDHVLYKNIEQPIAEAVEHETMGWLTKQTDEIMLIEHDRTIPNAQIPSGRGNGVIVLKSCIVEIRRVPLQNDFCCHLNPEEADNNVEYALQPTKRKTPKYPNGTGANK